MHVRLTGYPGDPSECVLTVSVSVLDCLSLCGPMMNWRPVQVPCCPMTAGIGPSPPVNPKLDLQSGSYSMYPHPFPCDTNRQPAIQTDVFLSPFIL